MFVALLLFSLVWFWGLLLFHCLGLGFFSPKLEMCEQRQIHISERNKSLRLHHNFGAGQGRGDTWMRSLASFNVRCLMLQAGVSWDKISTN